VDDEGRHAADADVFGWAYVKLFRVFFCHVLQHRSLRKRKAKIVVDTKRNHVLPYATMSKKKASRPRANEPETVSCHVRFPVPLYQWLSNKATPEFKSAQKKVIEIVLAAQEAESRQEQAA
jgi:hypothetical protein